ncbi:assimilatory nitrite reductase (NAD(P)H) large subunit precursor [Cognatiyoonia koreensis]|uniref:Assimilatory nitrite reductase (NAD(P)H) large subunit n=1 Tax=Cognatiyoonia koreensis TaxID=364200 RepID=A0A1I0MXR0_9RHOB|nr:nitrite reductase large subunit NirB [Cognatiyoonia koreensis]SEV93560.1 assimilatory nitrite reductase (NAD(P)H) large subunit precursor [Cognatiyoonia koreensis]
MKQNLVVIGAGMASGRVLEHLLEQDRDAYDITLFNAEARGNYNRIMLSPVLSGEKTYADIVTHDDGWYTENDITCRFGEHVVAIDRAAKTVTGQNGTVPYDKLLIATGSAPFIIPVPGKDLQGVITYRDLDDTNAMIKAAAKGGKAVVIGGGLLGLEAAAGLAERGMEVTVLHLMGHLMERQLDESAAFLLRRDLQDKGVKVICKASTSAILGETHVEAVLLEDKTVLEADLVVMAVGIRPETRLATDAGLEVARGVEVNAQLQTSDPDIFAVGECVEFDGQLFGLVAPLYDQAKVVAKSLLGHGDAFVSKELATKLKVTGCDLFSAGDFAEGDGREDIVFRDPARGVYRRLVIEDNVVIGAVMYGDTNDSNWFFGLIRDKTDIADMRDTLIFGPAYQGGTPLDPLAAVAALPRDAEICGCNGICKGQIEDAIAAGASDLGAIKSTTKASASCGTCTGLVEQVLAATLGDEFVIPAAATVCGCTDMTHEDVRRMIKSRRLTSMPAVWQECGWKTSCGCHVCRPALNFYLLADWPLEYRDDPQSRFINERKHANIQKDGTFSVVPRMWGGITTANELRAIADAADKYMVPTVKVTGGQRIDLLGVKSEDLPNIWADLNAAGMVSGHAYSKGLRTVKTCVGTDHCRFGTQDSTGLGIKLEKELWGSWTPHKLKLAVSGCPRNCAEATCKDIGVVCVDSGYQVSIGGAAGMDVKETELLMQVATEQEAINVIKAVTQLYRENAKYLDRIYKWMAKVGLDWIKARIETEQDALVDRFELSQSIYRKDPWAEHTQTKADSYRTLANLSLEAAE